jgi:hypothetical protein
MMLIVGYIVRDVIRHIKRKKTKFGLLFCRRGYLNNIIKGMNNPKY